jgi:hypothetical protein
MLQTDPPLLATHAAHADSIHLTNSGNSGSVEIGIADADGETEGAVVVVIRAVVIGAVGMALVENVVGGIIVKMETVDDGREDGMVDKVIGSATGGAELVSVAGALD